MERDAAAETPPAGPDLVARLGELKGKTLASWCPPAACHGQVLARLAEALGVDPAELVEG